MVVNRHVAYKKAMRELLRVLHEQIDVTKTEPWLLHITGEENTIADGLSRETWEDAIRQHDLKFVKSPAQTGIWMSRMMKSGKDVETSKRKTS